MHNSTEISVGRIENGFIVNHERLTELSEEQRQEAAAELECALGEVPAQGVESVETYCADEAGVAELLRSLADNLAAMITVRERFLDTGWRVRRRRRRR